MNIQKARKIVEARGQCQPNVTFRFFRVTDGPLVDRIREIFAKRDAWNDQCRALQKAIGASGFYAGHALSGFEFKKNAPPLDRWKQVHASGGKMWVPRGNFKDGRALLKQMKALGRNPDAQDALSAVDLHRIPMITHGHTWYQPGLWGSLNPSPLFFVKTPWREYGPELIEAYRIVRKARAYMSVELDFLADWKPHASMQEIAEWEALKETESRKAA